MDGMAEAVPTALGQVFYLSPAFSKLWIETRDHRPHPVLGGISSTRWAVYERFERSHASLADPLRNRPAAASAIQLVGRNSSSSPGLSSPKVYGIERIAATRGRLKQPGVLGGHRGRNRLVGSQGDDVLIGFAGRAGEVQAMVWMADVMPGAEGRLPIWMLQGVTLAVDDDGDQRADAWIELPGLGEWLNG